MNKTIPKLRGHEDQVNIFAPAVSSFKTFQDQDNPNSVVIAMEVTDMEKRSYPE